MLFIGKKIGGYLSNGVADSDYWAHCEYTDCVQPYWNGKVDFTFDEENNEFIHGGVVQTSLMKPYSFVSMYSHGTTWAWSTPEAEYYWGYMVDDLNRKNAMGTIITTIACDTNAFDRQFTKSSGIWYEKCCLSKSFLNSENSGVIAYLGSSREGFVSYYPSYGGGSIEYEREFYKHLFNIDPYYRTFGDVVKSSKMALASRCNNYNMMRWIQLGLNPIGDPEMPIYILKPQNGSRKFLLR